MCAQPPTSNRQPPTINHQPPHTALTSHLHTWPCTKTTHGLPTTTITKTHGPPPPLLSPSPPPLPPLLLSSSTTADPCHGHALEFTPGLLPPTHPTAEPHPSIFFPTCSRTHIHDVLFPTLPTLTTQPTSTYAARLIILCFCACSERTQQRNAVAIRIGHRRFRPRNPVLPLTIPQPCRRALGSRSPLSFFLSLPRAVSGGGECSPPPIKTIPSTHWGTNQPSTRVANCRLSTAPRQFFFFFHRGYLPVRDLWPCMSRLPACRVTAYDCDLHGRVPSFGGLRVGRGGRQASKQAGGSMRRFLV
ncbi:hypothetical protein BZA05DRAFT_27592 [Tricharina praecox]|uniref:uncharacterized protein n=1 Tax=Tricharina praecox TaxID=43433 RepID=UPI00221E5416|nr:uncharacterized protein BZA05DRAFT_27592 [Tricharina praecox]KAI5853392.1 hypothetical protein BZA05DRAFT_27592 [Tricharina praecox]